MLQLEQIQQETWAGLKVQLAEEGIRVIGDERLDAEREAWQREYFLEHVMPVITPQAIDPAHPFPFVANQGIGVLFALTRLADDAPVMEMVLIPAPLPRFVRIPGEEAAWISIEDLICRNADQLFPGFGVNGHGVFRILRDSDIEIEEDAEDLVRYYRTAIQRRRRGLVIVLNCRAPSILRPRNCCATSSASTRRSS